MARRRGSAGSNNLVPHCSTGQEAGGFGGISPTHVSPTLHPVGDMRDYTSALHNDAALALLYWYTVAVPASARAITVRSTRS